MKYRGYSWGESLRNRVPLARIRQLTWEAIWRDLTNDKAQIIKTLLATLTFCVGLSSPVFAADYRVSSGDSLYKIGQLFNVSSDTIIKTIILRKAQFILDKF